MTTPAAVLAAVLAVDAGASASSPAASHATWMGAEWLKGKRSDPQARDRVAGLCARFVRVLFPRAGPFRADGTIPALASRAAAARFVRRAREACPGVEVLPWLSGVVGRTARLADPAWRNSAARAAVDLAAALDVPGIHLDLEPPISERNRRVPTADLVALLEALDRRRPGIKRSVALPPLNGEGYVTGLEPADVEAIARHAEQLVPMVYDTGLGDAARYRTLVAHQVVGFGGAAMVRERGVEVFVGAASYEPHVVKALAGLHDPTVENLANAVQGLRDAGEAPTHVRGVAVYAEWTTDAGEWEALRAAP